MIHKKIVRVVVFGSRHMTDQKLFDGKLSAYLFQFRGKNIELVEGGCETGADKFAAEYADRLLMVHTQFTANWDLYGNKAGPLRNEVMAGYCAFNYGLAFWDGRKERCGTWDMIQRCDLKDISLKIIRI